MSYSQCSKGFTSTWGKGGTDIFVRPSFFLLS